MEFSARVRQEIDRLEQDIAHLKEQIWPIQHEISTLSAQRDVLSAYLNPVVHKQNIGGERVQAIGELLKEAAIPLHYTEILAQLKEKKSLEIRGKNPGQNLRALLSASNKFIRVGRGLYDLAENGKPKRKET